MISFITVTNMIFPVYLTVLIVGQTALEGFIGYRYLIGGWGDITLFVVPRVSDLLQPVFDAIRECILWVHNLLI